MYIAAYVIHNRPQMHTNDWKAFYHHLQAPYGVYYVISAKNNYTISCKISYFRYPLSTENAMMCYKERHPLLLKCLITFLRYIMMILGAPDRLYNPHMVHTVSFLPKITLIFHHKYQLLGTLSAWEMGCWCCN